MHVKQKEGLAYFGSVAGLNDAELGLGKVLHIQSVNVNVK